MSLEDILPQPTTKEATMPDEFEPTEPNLDDVTDHNTSGSYTLDGEQLSPPPARMDSAVHENDMARAAELWGHAIVDSAYASERYHAILDAARADGSLDRLVISLIDVALDVEPALKLRTEAFWAARETHALADAAAQLGYVDGVGPDSVEWPGEE